MILDLNEKIKETGNESHGSKNVTRPFAKPMKAIVNINNNENNASKANKSKRFSNLYLKAADSAILSGNQRKLMEREERIELLALRYTFHNN